jgi:3-hydroxyisobutyrate dehydrogenase
MATQKNAQKIGWIGMGRMGAPMAERLVKAGHDVSVWNRTKAKAEPLQKLGAKVVDRLADLANVDVLFCIVATGKDVEQVLLGKDGVASAGKVPKVVVDCSTIAVEESKAIRERLKERAADFVAAPVSGNAKVIKAGGLTMAVSGPEDTYLRVAHLLDHIAKAVTYVGEGDLSRLVKIAHNTLLGVVTQSLAEITVLAEKGGVSRRAFLEFLNNSVMGSVFTRYKTPAFVNLDFTPTFTPVLLRKDFDLALEAGRKLEVPMPVAAITASLVQASVGSGRVDEDFAILLEMQAAASGIELKPENVAVDDGLSAPEEDRR